MVVVAGTWELGWNTPIMEVDLWLFPLRDLGVTEFAMTPVSGIVNPKVKEFANFEEIAENYKLPIVIVEENGQTELKDFKHPKECIYMFGKANFNPQYNFPSAKTLRIETAENKGLLWPHQAASIVLYHRLWQ